MLTPITPGPATPTGPVAPPLFAERWKQRRAAIRTRWMDVLRSAVDPDQWQQQELWDRASTRLINLRLKQISFEPRIPHGRDREADLASRLLRIAGTVRRPDPNGGDPRLPDLYSRRLIALANLYAKVHGCYYTLKALKPAGPKKDMSANTGENWRFLRDRAIERGDDDVAWACGIALNGEPKPISDFIVEPMYVLRRMDGRQFRMVRLKNIHGERTPPVCVGAKAWSNTDGLREFCNGQQGGGYNWLAGHTELHELNADVTAQITYKFVRETARWGWQELVTEAGDEPPPAGETLGGLWVFGDGIVLSETAEDGAPVSRFLKPDKHGVYWVGPANGWVIGREDLTGAKNTEERGEPWGQDVPRIAAPHKRPGGGWVMPYLARAGEAATPEWTQVEKPESDSAQAAHRTELAAFMREYLRRLNETLGSMDAEMCLGLMASFAALPEIYREWSQQSGLWLHGEKGQGKNSVMRWLCKMWGLPGSSKDGVPFNSTEASLHVLSSQYSCLPAWLDEYMGTKAGDGWRDELLKGNLNRSARSKMTLGTGRREWSASLVVTGQHTSANAAVVSRYVHAQVSERKRKTNPDGSRVNHVEWFQKHRELFVFFGRELLLERGACVRRLKAELKTWMELPEMVRSDHRSAFVHGLAYAGLRALDEVLTLGLSAEGWEQVRAHVAGRCSDAVRDVTSRVDADQVLGDLVSALQMGVFGETPAEKKRFFYAQRELGASCPPEALDQGKDSGFGEWGRWKLYVLPSAVFGALSEHVRRQNRELALRPADFRAQISQRPCWVGDGMVKRFAETTARCWCFDLDRMPGMGYTPVDTDTLRGELLLWLARELDMAAGESIEDVNGQDPATAILNPVLPTQMTFRSPDGTTRPSKMMEGGHSAEEGWDWPDPRKGPLIALAEAVASSRLSMA